MEIHEYYVRVVLSSSSRVRPRRETLERESKVKKVRQRLWRTKACVSTAFLDPSDAWPRLALGCSVLFQPSPAAWKSNIHTLPHTRWPVG